MKRLLFRKSVGARDKKNIIADFKEQLSEYFGSEWRLLETPIMLDIDLVDILLLKDTGQLCAVKIVLDTVDSACMGSIVKDYAALSSRLHKMCDAYPDERIDESQKLLVRLFIPDSNRTILDAFSLIAVPVEVYQYFFITSHDHDGIVIERLSDVPEKKAQDYSAILKVMGENVRSETSSVEEETFMAEEAETEVHDDTKIEAEIETETETIPMTTVDEHHETAETGRENYFNRATLNEDELVAFFDFEKTIDTYRDEVREKKDNE